MEATNSLNIFTPTQTSVAKVSAPPKVNPPSLKEALHIVSPKLLPFALSLSGNISDATDIIISGDFNMDRRMDENPTSSRFSKKGETRHADSGFGPKGDKQCEYAQLFEQMKLEGLS